MHLEQAFPEATWESDRAIRARWHGSGARVRLADSGLHFPAGEAVGVELERYAKQLGRYQGAVADADPAGSAVWWFTPIGRVPLLTQWPQEAGGGDEGDGDESSLEDEMRDLQANLGDDWILRVSVQGEDAWLTAEKDDGSQHVEARAADVLAEVVELLNESGGRAPALHVR